MAEIVKLVNRDFKPSTVAADIGTKRDRLIRQITDNTDPYKQNKKAANEKALKLLPQAKKCSFRVTQQNAS